MKNTVLDIRKIDKSDFFNQKSNFDKIKFLLHYAILAPSTHNSQPWLLKIEDNSCKIFYDPSKHIREADPIQRDLYISFGCFLENFIIAAKYFNVFEDVKYILKDNLIAEIFFKDLNVNNIIFNKEYENVLDAILKRVNARGIFENKTVESSVIEKILQLNSFSELKLDLIQDKEKIRKLAELTAKGLKIAYASLNFRKEMSLWMNNSFSKRKEGIPGFSLRMPALISLIFPTLVRMFNISRGVSILNYKSISSAPLVSVISSKENGPLKWLDVGRLFERISLEMYSRGLKVSIFVASIEIGELYKEVQKVINSDLTPQLLFCIGYMDFEQKPNYRYQVEDKIIK